MNTFMANLNDYIRWRGDLPINSTCKFNEVDSMILARFSYLIFNKISLEEIETIESISNKMKNFENDEFRYNGDKEMITLLGKSNRFKDLIVTDFIEHIDKSIQKQFSAITIHISKKELYISYIGTDNSLVGWKEDFNLAFMETIPAQLSGVNYLSLIAQKYPEKKIRIGGHSKGGNIAIFSAISASPEIQNRLIKVHNFDGPGLDSKVFKEMPNKRVIKKIRTFLPQDSIIGRILNHEEECVIVKTNEKWLYQHDLFSWQVHGNSIVFLDKLTDNSEIVSKTIKEWLEETDREHRKIFFDGLFEVLSASNLNTVDELSMAFSKNLPVFIKRYKDISEEDRKIISNMAREFGKAYAINLREMYL